MTIRTTLASIAPLLNHEERLLDDTSRHALLRQRQAFRAEGTPVVPEKIGTIDTVLAESFASIGAKLDMNSFVLVTQSELQRIGGVETWTAPQLAAEVAIPVMQRIAEWVDLTDAEIPLLDMLGMTLPDLVAMLDTPEAEGVANLLFGTAIRHLVCSVLIASALHNNKNA